MIHRDDSNHSPAHVRFASTLDRIRRRWRLRRICEGAALSVVAALLFALIAVAFMDLLRFDVDAVRIATLTFYALSLAAFAWFVARPWLGRIRYRDVAYYLESMAPEWDALVISAAAELEAARGPRVEVSPSLTRRLLKDATDAIVVVDPARVHERRRSARALALAGVASAAMLALVVWGPPHLRHGLGLLFPASSDAAAQSPYAIRLLPGDVEIVRGADQLIEATVDGFSPERATLWRRVEGAEDWEAISMAATDQPERFDLLLFDLSASSDYYVESDGVRSPEHRIEVLPWPTVGRIDLHYRYPHRTGRAPETVENSGDIRGVRGTRVEVRVFPDDAVESGRLTMDDGRPVDLEPRDGALATTLVLERDGHYRVDLPVGDGRIVPATREYAIAAFDDGLPSAEIELPGRDALVTSVEEMEFKVRADDDVAVRDLELVVSINGGEERSVNLMDGGSPEPTVEARHTLYLEEHDLAPGDLIAYYVRAGDSAEDEFRRAITDLFFMEVRPFDRDFRDAGSGGGAAGGQQGGQDALAAQQRALVIALFKLHRDRGGLSREVFEERVATLEEAQSRVRDRVDAIVRRLGGRRVLRLNAGFEQMAESLPKAAAEMERVEEALQAAVLAEALGPAKTALLHLQRADAAFREVQIARQARGATGGRMEASDLANLFRLEMDRFRNQYEHVQRGQSNSPQQVVDETLERLRELAHRQQREVERASLRGSTSSGAADSQRALAEAVDELIRRLERLTREQPEAGVQDSLDALRGAAEAMRRGEQQESGSAAEAGREALDRLRQAQRELGGSGTSNLADAIGGAERQGESLVRRQREVRRSLDEAFEEGGLTQGDMDRIRDEKLDMIAEVRDLDATVRGLDSEADRQDQPADVKRALESASESLGGEVLVERLRATRRNLWQIVGEENRTAEEGIELTLEQVRGRLAAAARAAQEGGADPDQSLEQMRDIARDMDAVARRLDRASARQGERIARGDTGGATGGDGTTDGGGILDMDGRDLPDDLRQSFDISGNTLEQLRGSTLFGPRQSGDIEAVIKGLRDLASSEDTLGEAATRHAELLDELQRIELELRAQPESEVPRIQAERSAEPTPDYLDTVDEYFTRLSETQSR